MDQRIEVEVDTAIRYRIYQNLDSGALDPGYSLDYEDYFPHARKCVSGRNTGGTDPGALMEKAQ